MNHAASPPAGPDVVVYTEIVRTTLAGSGHLMERVIEVSRRALQAREDQARTPRESHSVMHARQHLERVAFVLCERFPGALEQAVAKGADQNQTATRSLFSVQFDELELMDESQLSENVERARARQSLAEAVTVPLAELNALMSAAQGQSSVDPGHNPLQPEFFLQALQTVVGQMQPSDEVRRDWMTHLAEAIGAELRTLYLQLIAQMQESGIKPAGYAVRQQGGNYVYVQPAGEEGHAPGFGPEAAPWCRGDAQAPAKPAAGTDYTLLTLHQLRRLLTGELADGPTPEIPFSERFSREFESTPSHAAAPSPDFDITVPAAFEALQEMKQVDHMMERLGNRGPLGTTAAAATAPQNPKAALGQALSMEVVALMLDNIARDGRLLWPVQQLVKKLEPALLKLAVADPRFFSDKDHPARRLLQEMTDRSLAFESIDTPGFESFMQPLIDVMGPLTHSSIEDQEPFGHALDQLLDAWATREKKREHERLRAIDALRHAEQRNLLAARMWQEMRSLPQIEVVPAEVARFLLGPWTQVMAQARLDDTSGSNDPGRYREAVDALIWSAQPQLTRINVGRLARLVPKLLSRLHAGLVAIDYPPTDTERFFELLMQLHQQAFEPDRSAQAPPPSHPKRSKAPTMETDEPWIAPSEAVESGFMDALADPQPGNASDEALDPISTGIAPHREMAVGTWVNLQVEGKWERTQLSWIGSHGNLFLFTNTYGHTQSMTRRLLDRLVARGTLQIISGQTVVAGALDAVAQTALRNSLDTGY
ncbi:MAG: DUF1631 family protein [Simplicispira suum]|uniref:DUF1631 family protein n=1 Tax=Simplicispira suum TaxID=2109915 RepID=UPI001C6AB9B8|nr:DUF1631 family protein [Simplicispira suum]MBW7834718.1 DUF1631 family protein [Simplicispira suum]